MRWYKIQIEVNKNQKYDMTVMHKTNDLNKEDVKSEIYDISLDDVTSKLIEFNKDNKIKRF